jgi:hypothetical protein
MERFVIGHNADPTNWRQRLEELTPRCLELFVPPRYCDGDGLVELRRAFEQMAQHPLAQTLEFASCHFPWGENAGEHSAYTLVDHQYFLAFSEIAQGFSDFCTELGLPPERSALNFHNLYELPRVLLDRLGQTAKLAAFRETLLSHAFAQTRAARQILALLDIPLTLVNENNPPVGDGDRMSVIDVFAEDTARRISELDVRTCMDLSHFFMTRFFYELPPKERPSFPYLELESNNEARCQRIIEFERYVARFRPLYFHISDTKRPGTERRFEGLPIGKGDTPWTDVLPALARYAVTNGNKLFLIVEIKGGHTQEGTLVCASSAQKLLGLIEDCFASGFIDAISEEGTAS